MGAGEGRLEIRVELAFEKVFPIPVLELGARNTALNPSEPWLWAKAMGVTILA